MPPSRTRQGNVAATYSFRINQQQVARPISRAGIPGGEKPALNGDVAPISTATKPLTRLLFFMHSPARIPCPNYCDRKAGIVPPPAYWSRWKVTGEESPTGRM